MIATPSVPPVRRVASLTAEPTPALARGTTPMIASVAGALVSPIPVPITTICSTIVRYVVDREAVVTDTSNAAVNSSPAVTTTFVPTFTASLVPRIDETATHIATGSKRTPADSGP